MSRPTGRPTSQVSSQVSSEGALGTEGTERPGGAAHQLRRGRPLAPHQAWAAVCCALVLAAGALLRTPWLAPLVLPVALLAPGYVIVARVAAAVEYDSGEGLWRTLALRLVTSVAAWTASSSVLVLLGADAVLAVWLVASGLVLAGLPPLLRAVRDGSVEGTVGPRSTAASFVDAARTWVDVLRLRHVRTPVVGGAVLVAALVVAVAVAGSGPRGVASSRAPFASISLATTGPGAASADGTVEVGADGISRVGLLLTGSGVPTSVDRLVRVQVRVDDADGTVDDAAFVDLPADGSTTVDVDGDWGRCWKRADVIVTSATDVPEVTRLLPRPLTLDGPGLQAGCRS